jgi:tight adherence protein B
MRDYNKVHYSLRNTLLVIGRCLIFPVLAGILFYKSLWAVLLLLPVSVFQFRSEHKRRLEEQRQRLNREFSDGLAGLSAALEAGYSVENAFPECIHDLRMIYPEDALIVVEFCQMQRQICNSRSVEEVLSEFADRSGDEDIACFAEVFSTAKRTGGDLLKIIRATERIVSEKAEINREIRTMVAAKRFEAGIMNVVPFVILIYFTFADPKFLAPLYETIGGRIIMTVLLAVYAGCLYLSRRITRINI